MSAPIEGSQKSKASKQQPGQRRCPTHTGRKPDAPASSPRVHTPLNALKDNMHKEVAPTPTSGRHTDTGAGPHLHGRPNLSNSHACQASAARMQHDSSYTTAGHGQCRHSQGAYVCDKLALSNDFSSAMLMSCAGSLYCNWMCCGPAHKPCRGQKHACSSNTIVTLGPCLMSTTPSTVTKSWLIGLLLSSIPCVKIHVHVHTQCVSGRVGCGKFRLEARTLMPSNTLAVGCQALRSPV